MVRLTRGELAICTKQAMAPVTKRQHAGERCSVKVRFATLLDGLWRQEADFPAHLDTDVVLFAVV